MFKKRSKAAMPAAALTAVAVAMAAPTPAAALCAPLGHARIAVQFDLAKGQTPENIALAPGGTAYVTFAKARQVAAVSPAAKYRSWPPCPNPPTPASTRRPWAFR